jgi:glycerol-3-phosphate dehydrogenase (NAD(P)+)
MADFGVVAVLGTGSWGTALAHHLASSKRVVRLWGVEREVISEIAESGRNSRYFPNETVSSLIHPTSDFDDAVRDVSLVVLAVPSFAMREVGKRLAPKVEKGTLIVSVAKGLEENSSKTMTEVLAEELGAAERIAALSGPSFALEVLRGLPTAVTVAATSAATAREVARYFHHGAFRVYTSSDVKGVQLGGAVKNVIALAVGVVDGVGMGANARAALITRGLAEMQRFILALGGESATVMGLSGLGDLLLTSTGDLSRNRRVGLRLGKGEELKTILKDIKQVAEGVETTHKVLALAERLGVQMPIVEVVSRLLSGSATPQECVKALLARAPKSEQQ